MQRREHPPPLAPRRAAPAGTSSLVGSPVGCPAGCPVGHTVGHPVSSPVGSPVGNAEVAGVRAEEADGGLAGNKLAERRERDPTRL